MERYRIIIGITDSHGYKWGKWVWITGTQAQAEIGGKMYADYLNTHNTRNTAVFIAAHKERG